MSWTSLPTEMQLEILRYLDNEELKIARLACKSFCEAADEALFKTIHISPNSRSFARAQNVAASDGLRKHVKSLVYHVGILGNVYPSFDAFRASFLEARRASPDVHRRTPEVLWCYNNWLEEIDGQTEFQARDELVEIQKLCDGFEHLESVSTVLDQYDNVFAEPQDFVGLRTGMPTIFESPGPHFFNLFRAASPKALTRLRGQDLDWNCFMRIIDLGDATCAQALCALKELELDLYNSQFIEFESHDRPRMLDAFEVFLRQTATVTTLKLSFDELPFEALGRQLLPISAALFQAQWPSLVKLELTGIVAVEEELVNFLAGHRNLTDLKLGDIELIGQQNVRDIATPAGLAGIASVPGSFISLFQQLHCQLQLRRVSLVGIFTNRLDEAWYVDREYEESHHLRIQLEAYLTRLGPCPFSGKLQKRQAMRYLRLQDDEADPLRFQDESWTWCPELLDK